MTKQSTEAPVRVDINIDEVLRLIPHRPPFLLVDRAEDFIAYRSLTGIKCVSAGEPYFVGHFPQFPVMPGVLIIEAMAQTGGLLMSKSMNLDLTRKTILFMAVDNCRFRQPVRPGDILRMPVEVIRARPEVARFKGKALVNDVLVAQVEFTAMVVEPA
jgi:3-hydroxyacyl-[acyl-carrier-protein] dehydratase